MPNERIVLGWAKPETPVPGLIAKSIAGELGIVSVDSDLAQDAFSRLQWQVALYEFGTDFLPVAPIISLAESYGEELALQHHDAFLSRLKELEGAGQISLGISWKPRRKNDSPATTGREWLNKRRQDHVADKSNAESSIAFFNEFENPEFQTRTRQGPHALHRDILLPRAKIQRLFSDISICAKEFPADAVSFTATGPWPPFSFAQPF